MTEAEFYTGRTPTDRERLLDELLDRQEIEACILRAARGIDRHDDELAKSAFHAGARDDHATFIGAAEDAVEWANRLQTARWRSHQHLLTNISIDLNGDEAHAETYVQVIGVPVDTWDWTMGGGRYIDRFERRDGRWGITDRITVIEWWDDPNKMELLDRLNHHRAQDRTDLSYARPLTCDRESRDLSQTSKNI
ncbi:nuclear transport factor 2 family protein [Nocardia abscessus]|uniref:nuclear transport factor 2 family protein n=1 Tax=Nocardia abscessus TaxID=120957 RepID=UPI0024578BA4|nr:nuclear transport factor 2 family protein [Nocardia abscessus]